jgi:hypothetical protein
MFRRASHLFGIALRETGQALDRLGLRVADNEIYRETWSRHRPIMTLYDKVCYLLFNIMNPLLIILI